MEEACVLSVVADFPARQRPLPSSGTRASPRCSRECKDVVKPANSILQEGRKTKQYYTVYAVDKTITAASLVCAATSEVTEGNGRWLEQQLPSTSLGLHTQTSDRMASWHVPFPSREDVESAEPCGHGKDEPPFRCSCTRHQRFLIRRWSAWTTVNVGASSLERESGSPSLLPCNGPSYKYLTYIQYLTEVVSLGNCFSNLCITPYIVLLCAVRQYDSKSRGSFTIGVAIRLAPREASTTVPFHPTSSNKWKRRGILPGSQDVTPYRAV